MSEEDSEFQALDTRLASIEECCAEIVGSLEKLRFTAHRMVEKMIVLDDLGTSLEVISAVAKTMTELVPTVGRLVDDVRHLQERPSGER